MSVHVVQGARDLPANAQATGGSQTPGTGEPTTLLLPEGPNAGDAVPRGYAVRQVYVDAQGVPQHLQLFRLLPTATCTRGRRRQGDGTERHQAWCRVVLPVRYAWLARQDGPLLLFHYFQAHPQRREEDQDTVSGGRTWLFGRVRVRLPPRRRGTRLQ